MGQVYSNCVSVPKNKRKQIGIVGCLTITCFTVLQRIRNKVDHAYVEMLNLYTTGKVISNTAWQRFFKLSIITALKFIF